MVNLEYATKFKNKQSSSLNLGRITKIVSFIKLFLTLKQSNLLLSSFEILFQAFIKKHFIESVFLNSKIIAPVLFC